MIYLIVQTFILLLISGLLGLILGWYLTRISAANSRASLQDALSKAKADARAMRAEFDALTTAKSNCDSERRLLSDELADLRARADSAGKDEMVAALQEELEQCRQSLAAAGNKQRDDREADAAAIASAAATAADGAQGLMTGAPSAKPSDDGSADNLQQIRGIGPKIAGILKELGIEHKPDLKAWAEVTWPGVLVCLESPDTKVWMDSLVTELLEEYEKTR